LVSFLSGVDGSAAPSTGPNKKSSESATVLTHVKRSAPSGSGTAAHDAHLLHASRASPLMAKVMTDTAPRLDPLTVPVAATDVGVIAPRDSEAVNQATKPK
jgi:hypothetical protein